MAFGVEGIPLCMKEKTRQIYVFLSPREIGRAYTNILLYYFPLHALSIPSILSPSALLANQPHVTLH